MICFVPWLHVCQSQCLSVCTKFLNDVVRRHISWYDAVKLVMIAPTLYDKIDNFRTYYMARTYSTFVVLVFVHILLTYQSCTNCDMQKVALFHRNRAIDGMSGRGFSQSLLGSKLSMIIVDQYFHHYFASFFPFSFSVTNLSHISAP